MSGGSWEYVSDHVQSAAKRLQGESDPARVAFGNLLVRCAQALHAIEWADSGDSARGSEVSAIMGCVSEADVIEAARERLRFEIARAQKALGGS